MTTNADKTRGLSDWMIDRLEQPARQGRGVRLTLSSSDVRLMLGWARIVRKVERPGLELLRAKKLRQAVAEKRRFEREVFWAGFRDRLGDLLIAYALTANTLWIIEAFWMVGR